MTSAPVPPAEPPDAPAGSKGLGGSEGPGAAPGATGSAARDPHLDPHVDAERPATLVLGLLGGIASGKSLAARLLAGPEGLVLSADALAHEVLASDEVARLVRERFGAAVLDPAGRPDRAALARLAFDPERGEAVRRALEGWTHPRVRARILADLREARARGIPRVVLDVPLLLENEARHGLTGLCDALIFVDAPLEIREARARSSRGWPAGEVARREGAQLPLGKKRDRADFVLSNHGTEEDLERAVADVLRRLGAR